MAKCLKEFLFIFFVLGALLVPLTFIMITLKASEGRATPNTITIAELRDEIKKGQGFYLNIDSKKQLRFKPAKYCWQIVEVKRKETPK